MTHPRPHSALVAETELETKSSFPTAQVTVLGITICQYVILLLSPHFSVSH